MSDKPIFLRFAPGYLAVLMVGAVMANPVFAQTSTQTAEQNATQPTTVKKSSAAKAVAKSEATSFVILSDVVVEGVQRSDPATVFNLIPVKIGDRFSADTAQQVSKALYGTGLYENVELSGIDIGIKIKLTERGVI